MSFTRIKDARKIAEELRALSEMKRQARKKSEAEATGIISSSRANEVSLAPIINLLTGEAPATREKKKKSAILMGNEDEEKMAADRKKQSIAEIAQATADELARQSVKQGTIEEIVSDILDSSTDSANAVDRLAYSLNNLGARNSDILDLLSNIVKYSSIPVEQKADIEDKRQKILSDINKDIIENSGPGSSTYLERGQAIGTDDASVDYGKNIQDKPEKLESGELLGKRENENPLAINFTSAGNQIFVPRGDKLPLRSFIDENDENFRAIISAWNRGDAAQIRLIAQDSADNNNLKGKVKSIFLDQLDNGRFLSLLGADKLDENPAIDSSIKEIIKFVSDKVYSGRDKKPKWLKNWDEVNEESVFDELEAPEDIPAVEIFNGAKIDYGDVPDRKTGEVKLKMTRYGEKYRKIILNSGRVIPILDLWNEGFMKDGKLVDASEDFLVIYNSYGKRNDLAERDFGSILEAVGINPLSPREFYSDNPIVDKNIKTIIFFANPSGISVKKGSWLYGATTNENTRKEIFGFGAKTSVVAAKHSYKMAPDGSFGLLNFDLEKLANNHLRVTKGGALIADQKVDSDTISLLTKNYSKKRQYSPESIKVFRDVVHLAQLPQNKKAGKFHLVADVPIEGGRVIYASETPTEGDLKVDRLVLLMSSIKAGNDSPLIRNEISGILDYLLASEELSPQEHKKLFKQYVQG